MATDKKTILVVDDDLDQRTFLATVLEDHGYCVLMAEDGQVALETARREKPDLVVLDLQMPNQTGTDFCRRLSRDRQLSHTPVIVVSGLAGRDLAIRKPAAVFDKPVDHEEFIAAVQKSLA